MRFLLAWKEWALIAGLALALATTCTLFYKAGERAKLWEAEATSLGRWGDLTCALTGVVFRTPEMKRATWGDACRLRIQELVDREKAADQALAKHAADQAEKSASDLAAARRAAQTAANAAKKMEKANVAVDETGRVGADWFGALSELGGLRGPAEAVD